MPSDCSHSHSGPVGSIACECFMPLGPAGCLPVTVIIPTLLGPVDLTVCE